MRLPIQINMVLYAVHFDVIIGFVHRLECARTRVTQFAKRSGK